MHILSFDGPILELMRLVVCVGSRLNDRLVENFGICIPNELVLYVN